MVAAVRTDVAVERLDVAAYTIPNAARLLEANRDEEAEALERVRALGARLASEAAAR